MRKQRVVVMGVGGMGKLFGRFFESSSCVISYVGREVTTHTLQPAEVLVIATPPSSGSEVASLLSSVQDLEHKLIICLWSYMRDGEKYFADITAPIVYIHFLFGPDIESMSGQNIIIAGATDNERFQWYLRKMKAQGARVRATTLEQHDKIMAYTQSLSQLSSILLGISLARSGYNREQLHSFASLTFRLNRHTIERIMKQKAELWAELQFENEYYEPILRQYQQDFTTMLTAVLAKDKQQFIDLFSVAGNFWEEWSPAGQSVQKNAKPLAMRKDAELIALGPRGTYSHEAARLFSPKAKLVLGENIHDVIQAVYRGEVSVGIVPIENTIQGIVVEALDNLYAMDMVIEDEIILDINHVICALERPQSKDAIKVIYSHPQALGQCREYLAREYPGVPQIATVSTAAAMQKIVEQKDLSALAIGPEFAAKMYRMPVLEREIQDRAGNQTRFVVFRHKKVVQKTPLNFIQAVIIPKVDRAGLLADILVTMKQMGINLSYIESRPNRDRLGSYVFYARLEIMSDDKRYAEVEKLLDDMNVKIKRLSI